VCSKVSEMCFFSHTSFVVCRSILSNYPIEGRIGLRLFVSYVSNNKIAAKFCNVHFYLPPVSVLKESIHELEHAALKSQHRHLMIQLTSTQGRRKSGYLTMCSLVAVLLNIYIYSTFRPLQCCDDTCFLI
jgi:hypothetical protein